MKIRLALPGDGAEVVRLSRLMGARETSEVLGHAVNAEGGRVPLVHGFAFVLVAEEEGRVVGMACLQPDMDVVQAVPESEEVVRRRLAQVVVKLEALVVAQGRRGHGIGTELAIAVENVCAAQRVHVVSVDVANANKRAREFFSKRKYRALDLQRGLPLKIGDRALVLRSNYPGFARMVKVRSLPTVYTGRG